MTYNVKEYKDKYEINCEMRNENTHAHEGSWLLQNAGSKTRCQIRRLIKFKRGGG